MQRLTPLANAPFDGSTLSVLAAYGEASAFVKNIRANNVVRFKRRGRWYSATDDVLDPTPDAGARLGRYARLVLVRVGPDPKVIRLTVT